MFIATANSLSTHSNAIVRTEWKSSNFRVIRIEEKVEIAKRHLIKKQMEETGLQKTLIN